MTMSLTSLRAARRRSAAGFTLIELMIVVAIVAILAMVAYPAFMEQVRKSRRADAVSAISQIQQAQERWRANNTTYTTSLTNLNVSNPASGYYTLSIPSATATGYSVTATAAGAQSSDSKCTAFTLQMNAGVITYGSTGSGTWQRCWNR
jgi:type IV pilus assembly protein PilE